MRAKLCFNYTWAEYYLRQTHLDGTTHELTSICRQLFTGHMVGYQPMKWQKVFFLFFSVGNNNILEHSDACAHLLGCHLETDLERKLQDLAHGKWQLLSQDLEHFTIICLHVHVSTALQWHPTITKCHGTEKKSVRYNGVFIIAKTQLKRSIWLTTKYSLQRGNQAEQWNIHHAKQFTDLRVNSCKLWRSKFPYLDQ